MNYKNLSGSEIASLLQVHPELYEKLEIDKMDGDDIAWVLGKQPDLREKLKVLKNYKK